MNVPQDGFTQRFRIKPFSGKQISGHSGSLDARPRELRIRGNPLSIAQRPQEAHSGEIPLMALDSLALS
jgi:hypothetical protein